MTTATATKTASGLITADDLLRLSSDGGGANAYVVVHPGTEREERYPGIASNIGLAPGESFSIETGGGGGVLPPAERDRELVKGDLQDGLVTPRKAREVYGLTEEEVAAALAG